MRALRSRPVLWALLTAALAFAYRPIFSGQLVADRDVFRIFFPDSAFLAGCLSRGELPLWQPYAFIGQPFTASLQAQVFYPPRVLAVLLTGPYWSITVLQLLHVALAAAGTFLLARALGRSRPAALLAAAAFGCSPLLTDLATTPNLVHAAAWAPWVARAALRGRTRALAGFLALSLLAGAPEMVLWQLALVAALSFRRWRSVAAGVPWAFALAAAALLPAAELALESARRTGRADPLDWSASPIQLLAMGWPLADWPRGPYWGQDQWLILQLFLGTGVTALAIFGARRAGRARAFAAAAVLFSVLALGRHFPPSGWLLSLPPLGWFRYPAKYLVGAAFCLSVLSAFGVDRLSALARRRRRVRPWWVGAVVIAALVLLPVGTFLPRGWPWVVLTLAAVALAARVVPARLAGRSAVGVCLAELLVFHVLQVGYGWAPAGALSRPSAIRSMVDLSSGRVSVEVGRKASESQGEVVLSREPSEALLASRDLLVPNRFMEDGIRALEGYGAPEPERLFQFHLTGQRAVQDLAGVRYFVRTDGPPHRDTPGVGALPGGAVLYQSDTAFPRAWVVSQARVASDEEARSALQGSSAPFRELALLADGEPLSGEPCPAANTRVIGESCRSIDLEATACGDAYLILADSFAPGWRAEVNGTEREVHRADIALRAVRISAGKNLVRMSYTSGILRIGLAISLMALLALILGIVRRFTFRGAP